LKSFLDENLCKEETKVKSLIDITEVATPNFSEVEIAFISEAAL